MKELGGTRWQIGEMMAQTEPSPDNGPLSRVIWGVVSSQADFGDRLNLKPSSWRQGCSLGRDLC